MEEKVKTKQELEIPKDLKETPRQRRLDGRIFIASSFILAILFVSGIFLYTKTRTAVNFKPTAQKVNPNSTAKPDENWQIYEGSDFSIEYPADWTAEKGLNDFRFYPPGTKSIIGNGTKGASYVLVTESTGNPAKCNNPECPSVEKVQDFSFGGVSGQKVEGAKGTDGGNYFKKYVLVSVPQGKIYRIIELYGNTNTTIPEQNSKVFNEMVSTFKFIQPTPIPSERITIRTIYPTFIPYNYVDIKQTYIVITGTNFDKNSYVAIEGPYDANHQPNPMYFRDHNLTSVNHESDTRVTAQIPSGLPPGFYTVIVKNPNGDKATTQYVFERGPDPSGK